MRRLLLMLGLIALGIPMRGVQDQAGSFEGLPKGAVILDQEAVPSWAHRDRLLLFWVLPPPDKPLSPKDFVGDLEYTCQVETTGHSRLLPARVSLVDTLAKKIVNTIAVKWGAGDAYNVPLRIRPGLFYEVRRPLKNREGAPHILALHDFNDDGRALEFAFYIMDSCNGPMTMLMGYSERQDRVIAYDFSLNSSVPWDESATQPWMYRITFRKPVEKMHWHYIDEYNSGVRVEYDFRYIPDRERFEGEERLAR